MKLASLSLVFALLAYFSVPILSCAATSSFSSAVLDTDTTTTEATTTTEMTTTTIQPCSPASLTLGTADGMDMIDVINAGYAADDTAMIAVMIVSCTANANMFANMSFNGGAFTPIESDSTNPMQTISVTLTCSYDTMQWSYSATIGGATFTRTVTQVTCGQA